MVYSHAIKYEYSRFIEPRLSAWRKLLLALLFASLTNGSIGSSSAGTITTTIGSQREFQLALRIAW
jgi:hypothetical protein